MRKIIFVFLVLFLNLALGECYAQDQKSKIILLIAEQNIEGPQSAWWVSEIDLSTTEAVIARRLIEQGYNVVEPFKVTKIIEQKKAFRRIGLSEGESIKLGNLSKADYVVLGKAVASSGGSVPQSKMVSCFANISAKLIRVKDSRLLGYIAASGSSAHMDVVTGGKEALTNAASDLATKVIVALSKEGGE